MPQYLYSNPDDENDIVEVFQGMLDKHEYFIDGVQWNRVFTNPQASIMTKIDPFSQNQFLEKTAHTKGTMGDLWSRSEELSLKRAEITQSGDPVKQASYDAYRKKNKGKKSLSQLRDEQKGKTFEIKLDPKKVKKR